MTASSTTGTRYEVRERNARHGVWDRYLARLETLGGGQDEMAEYDAKALAAELNSQPISWHLDPTVARSASWGRYMAEVWGTGDGDNTGWCVFAFGARNPADAGSGTSLADAERQAEAALRRLNEANAPA
jgi:hypothetical protein